jgi:hypothetical protein
MNCMSCLLMPLHFISVTEHPAPCKKNHSIGMCRMWWFLAFLRKFFHSSLLYTLSFHPFSTNYSSIFPHFILPSISWSTSQPFWLLLQIKILSTHHILSYDNAMKTVGVKLLDTHYASSLTAFHILLWVMIHHTVWQNVAWSQWPVQNSVSVVADKLQHRSLAEFSVKDVTALLLEHQYNWGWVTAWMIIE